MCAQSCKGRALTAVVGNISSAAHDNRILDSRICALSAYCQVNDWGLLWYEPQNYKKASSMLKRIWDVLHAKLTRGKQHDPSVVKFQVRGCTGDKYDSGVVLQLWRVLEEHGGFIATP